MWCVCSGQLMSGNLSTCQVSASSLSSSLHITVGLRGAASGCMALLKATQKPSASLNGKEVSSDAGFMSPLTVKE